MVTGFTFKSVSNETRILGKVMIFNKPLAENNGTSAENPPGGLHKWQNPAIFIETLEIGRTALHSEEFIQAVLPKFLGLFDLCCGCYWSLDDSAKALKCEIVSGSVAEEFKKGIPDARCLEGENLPGTVLKLKNLVYVDDISKWSDSRRDMSIRCGVKSCFAFPVTVNRQIIGVLEFFSQEKAVAGEQNTAILKSYGELVANGLDQIHSRQVLANNRALNEVLEAIDRANTSEEIASIALNNVREAFGWLYGTSWLVDPQDNVLRCIKESGSTVEEFCRMTRAAKFPEGTGLPGLTWQKRDVLLAPYVSKLSSFPRKDAAERAGIVSGVCFPIIVDEQVIGATEFFSKEVISLNNESLQTLRNVGKLVSSAMTRIIKKEKEQQSARKINGYSLELVDFSKTTAQLSSTILQSAQQSENEAKRIVSISAEMSKGTNTIAAATEEMVTSIKEISRNTSFTAQITQQASEKSDETKKIIDMLGKSAKDIDSVVEIMKKLASQTNLLALNAKIEAASAGDAGLGFAVVANEVKELSKQSESATEDIRTRIEEIQKNTFNAVTAINDIVAIIEEINQANRTIAGAVEEQSSTANEISVNISGIALNSENISKNILYLASLAETTTKNAQNSQEVSMKSSENLYHMSEDLKHLIE